MAVGRPGAWGGYGVERVTVSLGQWGHDVAIGWTGEQHGYGAGRDTAQTHTPTNSVGPPPCPSQPHLLHPGALPKLPTNQKPGSSDIISRQADIGAVSPAPDIDCGSRAAPAGTRTSSGTGGSLLHPISAPFTAGRVWQRGKRLHGFGFAFPWQGARWPQRHLRCLHQGLTLRCTLPSTPRDQEGFRGLHHCKRRRPERCRAPTSPVPLRCLPPLTPRWFSVPQCGGGTFTLRFHFCTSRRGQFVLVWWQSPREGMVMVMLRSALGSRAALSTLSILVALLIAGQAVTIYFVYQQSGQISKLTKTSQTLQLEALQRKLPTGAKTVNKMKMAMVNSPMVMRVLPMVPTAGNTAMAPASNRTEDQVKHLLLQADPRKMFPELKDNLMDNLKRLKSTMAYEDWQSFESWMHKWLLFEMAKNPKPEEEQKEIPAKKVLSKCQAEASAGGVHPGRFQPQCDENGDFLPKQCNASTGYCWCSYKNGTRIEGTATRGKLDCEVAATAAPRTAPELEEMMFSGVDMLRLGAEKVN